MKIYVAFLLCFSAFAAGSPIEPIEPNFNPITDCRLFLQTRENRGNSVEIRFQDLSSIPDNIYRRGRPLRISIHGWGADANDGTHHSIARVLLDRDDFNFIFLDWSAGAQTGINYVTARNRVPAVGEYLAAQLDWMASNGLIILEDVTIIGFSLGAHVAGLAGKNTQGGKVGTIFALDPAGPLFSVNAPNERVASGDALYVEAIHTNGRFNGIGAQIADADFFPNGGSSQPGCQTGTGCSHSRAVGFYMESVGNNNQFRALRCTSEEDASSGNCSLGPSVLMGGEPSNRNLNVRGIFHLTTNAASPFGQG